METDPIEFVKSKEGQDWLLRQLGFLGITDHAEREDIRSEMTLKLLNRKDTNFRGDASVKYWLAKALKNTITDYRRKQYGREYGRDIKIPDEVTSMGEDAVLIFRLINREGFTKARQAFEQFKTMRPTSHLSWPAFQVLAGRLPDSSNQLRHHDNLEDAPLIHETGDPTKALGHKQVLNKVLSELEPSERMAIVMKSQGDLNPDVCKKLFETTINWETCRKRVNRLINKIKQRLMDQGLSL